MSEYSHSFLPSSIGRGPVSMVAMTMSFFLASGCVKQLPPAATPEPIAPTVGGTPAPGLGRLVVDVVDGPTEVKRVTMIASPRAREGGRQTYTLSESFEVLCPASPCVLDVAPGNVLLRFPTIGNDDVEVELVHVGLETSVYRRASSVYDGDTGALRVLGIVAAVLGVAAVITGLVLLPTGLGDGDDDMALAGGVTLGSGALLMALGIWGARADAPTFRPSSAVHFPLER